MKKINLRELYPDVYPTDLFIDVTEEVMETIRAAERAEAAYERNNQLLRIEELLGDSAVYPGMDAFNVKKD